MSDKKRPFFLAEARSKPRLRIGTKSDKVRIVHNSHIFDNMNQWGKRAK